MIRSLLLASLLLLLPPPASAQAPRGWMDTGLRHRAAELSAWVVAHTDYDPLPWEPVIIFLSPGEITLMARGVSLYSPGHDDMRGMAIPDAGIFLLREFRIGRDDDVLLHEIVHIHQFADGQVYGPRTRCRMEEEAYRLQAEFIRETGIGQEIDPAFLLLVTTGCGE